MKQQLYEQGSGKGNESCLLGIYFRIVLVVPGFLDSIAVIANEPPVSFL